MDEVLKDGVSFERAGGARVLLYGARNLSTGRKMTSGYEAGDEKQGKERGNLNFGSRRRLISAIFSPKRPI